MIESIDKMDAYFNSFSPNFGKGTLRENRLERMEALLDRLNRPEESFSTYHIAGSKGKGTTASYLSGIIAKRHGSCGLYMSPHVYDVRERFSNATKFYPESLYIETINELDSKIKTFTLPESLGPEKPTTFELYTAFGYLLFKNAGEKHAVIETGLGGRLDATNTLKNPKAVIFTLIELEHTNVLGNTFEEIANEKLGIVRDVAKVYYYQERLEKELVKRNIKANFIDTSYKSIEKLEDGSTSVEANDGCKLLLQNASTTSVLDAIFAYSIAKDLDFIDDKSINLRDISLPARFEKIALKSSKKEVLFEGAHTYASTTSALISFKEMLSSKDKSTRDNATLIFSLADGKDIEHIEKAIIPEFKNIVITGLGEFKKSEPKKIFSEAKAYITEGTKIVLKESAIDAVEAAISTTGENDIIFVLGSFYLANEIKIALKELGYVD